MIFMMLIGSLSISCNSGDEKTIFPNTLTDEEKKEGWTLLFGGETTNGWRGYSRATFPQEGWIVENGTLRCIGTGMGEAGGRGGDIIYDKKFHNFRLSLEWKISPGGNSGIFYLGQEIEGEGIGYNALEMQILDNERHPDAFLGVNGNRQAGALYDLIPANPQNTRPAGEWNHAEVLVYRGTVVHFQNGVPILEYHLGTPAFNRLVEGSKFADLPEFGKNRPGYIALQDHGDDVWFRNIKILEMDY